MEVIFGLTVVCFCMGQPLLGLVFMGFFALLCVLGAK